MRAIVLLTYDVHDIRRILLANAPQDTRVDLFRTLNYDAPSSLQLAAMVRIPSGASDPESIAWTPYTVSYTAGNDAVLIIDHATLLDILTTDAMDTLNANGLKVLDSESATISVHDQDPLVSIQFPLEGLRAPQRHSPIPALR